MQSINPLHTMREESEPLPLCSIRLAIAFLLPFRTLYTPFHYAHFYGFDRLR